MNIKERNKFIAVRRWKHILEEQLNSIPKDKESLKIKSAICGFLAGDGSVQIRRENEFYHYQIDFFPDNVEMLDTYVKFIQALYKKEPSISRRDNVYVARLSNKAIVLDLKRECSFGIYNWSFPKNLFKIKGAEEYWLKAFYSAEGYVNDKTIKIQSVNTKSLKIVSKLLKKFRINNRYYEYLPKNEKHSKVGMIFINDRKSRVNYLKKIGFWHSKKENLLAKSLGL